MKILLKTRHKGAWFLDIFMSIIMIFGILFSIKVAELPKMEFLGYLVFVVLIIFLPIPLIGIIKNFKVISIFYITDDNKYLIFQLTGSEDVKIPLDNLKSFTLIQDDRPFDNTDFILLANLNDGQTIEIFNMNRGEFTPLAKKIASILNKELSFKNYPPAY